MQGGSQKRLLSVMPPLFLAGALLFVSGKANSQTSPACISNEPSQTLSFSTSPWNAGSLSYSATVGAAPNDVQVSATATGGNWLSGNPVSGAQIGGTANAVSLGVNRDDAGQTNTVTFNFSKPINNLQMMIGDLDYFNNGAGAYNDMVTIVGTNISGNLVQPVATAINSIYVTASGNMARASDNAGNNNNCPLNSTNCNANFKFSTPVSSVTITYANSARASGNPPNQAIGVTFVGYCLQNGQLLNLSKSWVNAVAGHTATATTSSNRLASAPMPAAVNATFNSTAPSATSGAQVRVFPGETITLPAETFGGGASAATYTTTLQCTGGTPLASGSAARSITISNSSTDTVCTYTNSRGSADLKITKTGPAVVASNGSLTYTITATVTSAAGLTSVTGATLKDLAAAGITKTSVSCDASVSTNKCTTPPSIVALEGAGYTLPTLAVGDVFQILVQATVP